MNKVTLTRPCPFCHKSHSIMIDRDEYEVGMAALYAGALIQNAFPKLTLDEREFILTGICPTCWDSMWGLSWQVNKTQNEE